MEKMLNLALTRLGFLLLVGFCLFTQCSGMKCRQKSLASLSKFPWEPECHLEINPYVMDRLAKLKNPTLERIANGLYSLESKRMLLTASDLSLNIISQIPLETLRDLKLNDEQKTEILSLRGQDLYCQCKDSCKKLSDATPSDPNDTQEELSFADKYMRHISTENMQKLRINIHENINLYIDDFKRTVLLLFKDPYNDKEKRTSLVNQFEQSIRSLESTEEYSEEAPLAQLFLAEDRTENQIRQDCDTPAAPIPTLGLLKEYPSKSDKFFQ